MRKILLSLLMLITVVPLWAREFCFDEVIYNITDETNKTVEITGINGIPYDTMVVIPSEVESENGELYTVTSIAAKAFEGNEYIGGIELPNTITAIGSSAFYNCTNLDYFYWDENWDNNAIAATIGNGAFYGCSRLDLVYIPDNVTSIGGSAFNGCSSLTEMYIPDNVTSLGSSAFYGCSSLTEIHMSENLTSLSDRIFYGCSNLSWINFPEVLTSIGIGVFYECSSLTEIHLPETLTSIGRSAFGGCFNLTEINIPKSVILIEEDAFRSCHNLNAVKIADLTSWSKIEFRNELSNPLYYVKKLVINGTEVNNLEISNELTAISSYAFVNCKGLTSVSIQASINHIGFDTFLGCENISVVKSHNTTAPIGDPFDNTVKENATLYVPAAGLASYQSTNGWKDFVNIRTLGMEGAYDFEVDGLYYLIRSLYDLTAEVVAKDDNYKSYSGDIVIPTSVSYRNREFSVTSIAGNAFYKCENLTSITIPHTISEIGLSAFKGCNNLTKVTIQGNGNNECLITNDCFNGLPIETLILERDVDCTFRNFSTLQNVSTSGVTQICDNMFNGCSGLTSLTIGSSVETVGSSAFAGCSKLRNLIIEDSSSSLVELSFVDSPIETLYYGRNVGSPIAKSKTTLTNLTIGNQVSSITSTAFQGCTGLKQLVLSNSVTEIGAEAFYGCTGLTELVLSNSLAKIDESAFQYCDGITELVIPNSVTEIGAYAFYGCTGLTELVLSNSLAKIDASTFQGCFGITELEIPHSVTEIGAEAFQGCTGLTELVLSNSLAKISRSAFQNCRSIRELVIPNSMIEIGNSAFLGCSGITELIIPSLVTSIGNSAFEGCSLHNLSIQNGKSSIDIGYNAFWNCPFTSLYLGRNMNLTSTLCDSRSLSKVTIGYGMTSLSNGVFVSASGIKELIVEDAEDSIVLDNRFEESPIETIYIGRDGTYEFTSRVELKEVTIGNKVTAIPNNAFNGCSNMSKLTLGNRLHTVGKDAFIGCATLMSVYSANPTPPQGVVFDNRTYLYGTLYVVKGSKEAYMNADGWKEFWEIVDSYNLPQEVNGLWYNIDESNNATIVANPFNVAYTGVITIPASIDLNGHVYPVTAIDPMAFADAYNVTSVTIEYSDEPLSVGASAESNEELSMFGACMLNSVNIGRNLSYRVPPFSSNSSLNEVTIGDKVTSMGGAMFAGCENIKSVVVLGSTPASEAEFEQKVYDNAILTVPVGALEKYANAAGWCEFENIQDSNGSSAIDAISFGDFDSNEPTIIVSNGEIIVNCDDCVDIAVYNVNGSLIYKGQNRPIAVARRGVYVVYVKGQAKKVMV